MAKLLAIKILEGSMTWEEFNSKKSYARYKADVLAYIDSKGYYINEAGECVRKPADTTKEDVEPTGKWIL